MLAALLGYISINCGDDKSAEEGGYFGIVKLQMSVVAAIEVRRYHITFEDWYFTMLVK